MNFSENDNTLHCLFSGRLDWTVCSEIERDCRIRVIRENRIIGEYPLDSLKRIKEDVKEVRDGYECGIKLKGFNDLKDGDILEAYKIESIARTF